MEDLLLTGVQWAGAALVAYTAATMLSSLALLAMTVVGVGATWRYLRDRLDTALPAEGRVVLITGCDTGIGHDAAVSLSQRGVTVVAACLDRHSEGAQGLDGIKRIHVIQMDVTDDASIQAALQEVTSVCGDGGLWAVVNNAGLNRQAPVELMSMTTFRFMADVMLFGTVNVTKTFLPLVRRAKGRVVNISSDRGMLSPPTSAAYCIAKHGVETFSDVLRAEMTPYDVSVSVIQPGHFGGATAIINPQNEAAMQSSMERDLHACPEEVQRAYGGQRAVDAVVQAAVASKDFSPSDVTPVVRAVVRAVTSSRPDNRYPVQGTTGPVDWGIVLGKIHPLLPDSILFWVQSIVMKNHRM